MAKVFVERNAEAKPVGVTPWLCPCNTVLGDEVLLQLKLFYAICNK
jgi:hypothetical protein